MQSLISFLSRAAVLDSLSIFLEDTNELTFSNIQRLTLNKDLAGGGARTHTALREMSCRAKSRHLSIFLRAHKRAHVFKHPTPNIQRPTLNKDLAGGGARTHTALRPLDFESSASANSATPAL